jgi:hypothetical protein
VRPHRATSSALPARRGPWGTPYGQCRKDFPQARICISSGAGRPRPRPVPWPARPVSEVLDSSTEQAGRGRPARTRGSAPTINAESHVWEILAALPLTVAGSVFRYCQGADGRKHGARSGARRLKRKDRCYSVLKGRQWSGRPDSNRRHRPWQGRTLPAELLPPVGETTILHQKQYQCQTLLKSH